MSGFALPGPVRVELACFAALASFCALHWVALVAAPPLLGAGLAVAVATAAGASLWALGARSRRRNVRLLLAAIVAALALALAMALVGLPVWLLGPDHWDELAGRLANGLDGAGSVGVPYDGADDRTRLAILMAAPVTLVAAAVAGFWPGGGRARGRIVALVLLVGLFTVMAAWRTPDGYLAQGLALLALIAAWLWAPSLIAAGLGRASAALCAAALVAAPLVAALDRDDPLLDYRSWRLFGANGISFSWEHSYGPLDWPQRGALLLSVASDGAHYWKAENLDRFDGVGWSRSDRQGPEPGLGGPSASRRARLPASHPWVDRINFEVRNLRSDVVISAGTTLEVDRIEARPAADAVWTAGGDVERGDEYTVLVYTPDPTPAEMRSAPSAYPRQARRYTALSLSGDESVRVPFWGRGRRDEVEERFQGTPYADVYAHSRRLVAGAPTPFDAAAAIESELLSRYRYAQDVPQHRYPLAAFLLQDRRGYCQQFSGAMALMLRMSGVPARVATGFSPGGRDPDRGTFLVEDLDAHSWVEVFFPGIGWVPFDPTPAVAPAEAQLGEEGILASGVADGPSFAAGTEAEQAAPDSAGTAPEQRRRELAGEGGGDSGPGIGLLAAPALVAALLAGLLYAGRAIRRRRLAPDALAEAELAELRSAVARLGWELDQATTLLQLERRLASSFGRAAWLYATRLRERRFRDPSLTPPRPRERRRLRRALLAGAGLRGLLALPPGGPASRG